MKYSKFITIFLVLLSSQYITSAQTSQRGIVKEYREENNKRPLSGVEVEITNAGSVVSDKKGDFLLEFRTFKPGQKVNVRRIEKNGYEIFNKEALEQWNINPDEPFTIVMVKRELFKEIRDSYSRVSSKSYAEQYEKEKAALDQERLNGRLSEEKHREELEQLSEWYDIQLSNLDNYIDRFARIDLSELDKNEHAIIELVKEGRLEEAIEKYNERRLIETFESETADHIKITEGINALNEHQRTKQRSIYAIWDILKRQMDVYVLKGGRDSYEKISDILRRAAHADPTNLYIMSQCITYAGHINHISLQKSLYELCDIENIEDTDYRILLSLGYSNALIIMGEYEKAIPYAEYVISAAGEENRIEKKGRGLSQLMSIYEFTMQIDKQNAIFNELIQLCNDDLTGSLLSNEYKYTLNHDIAAHYDKLGDHVNCNKYLLVSHELVEDIYVSDPNTDNLRRYVNVSVSLGTSYYNVGDIKNSMKHLKKVQSLIEEAGMTQEPSFIQLYYAALKQLGISYFELGNYENCETLFVSALKIIESTSSDMFIIEEKTDMYNNLGYLYFTTSQFEKSEKMYQSALDICYKPYTENPNKYIFNIFRVQINLSSLYLALEDYNKVIKYGKDAIFNCEIIYSVYPDFVADEYILTLHNMAQAATALGQKEYATELLNKAYEIRPDDAMTKKLKGLLLQ